jgi:hypothetical protein
MSTPHAKKLQDQAAASRRYRAHHTERISSTRMTAYRASRIGCVIRKRATPAALKARRTAYHKIVESMRPISVRGIYYQAIGRRLIEKTENAYKALDHDLVQMRRAKELPYAWITDGTRYSRRPYTCDSIEQALQDTAQQYRKSLWNDIDAYVEIWVDKDTMIGVLEPVTNKYDVNLMPYRGQTSDSFVYTAAEHISKVGKPTYIYHLGDYDFWGVAAANAVEKKLRAFTSDDVDIHFERVAVLLWQIKDWKLPTRPSKKVGKKVKNFGPAVEIDAIDPERLRDIVEECILRHMPAHQFEVLMAAEESACTLIRNLIKKVT